MTALCLASPAFAATQALDCPEPAPVFVRADAKTFDLSKLAQTVGTAKLDDTSLYKAAEHICSDFPGARNADVAEIMITANCTYLNTDVPADHRSESDVSAFEQLVYDAVFGGAPPKSYPRQQWLLGN